MSVTFSNKQSVDFVTTLRNRVDNYFAENQLSKNANAAMVVKTITLFAIYFGAYGLLYTSWFSPWQMLGLVVIMGVGKAGIGFSVAHDAIHGAYSSNKVINRLLGLSMNIIGGSDYVWKITHNFVHHTYTNIHEMDEDLAVTSLMRLSPSAERKPIHKFQYLYFPLIYSLTTISWVFIKDYKKLSQEEIGPYKKKGGHPRNELLLLAATKSVYYLYTIILPLLLLPVTWGQFLIGLVVMHLTAGFILGIVFQLAHVVEETEHPLPDTKGKMENAWAVHQMITTANFGRTNKLLCWYVGGLNFQVEHHLFPNICSIHYPAISRIVEETAHQFKVPYNANASFRSAVFSHVRMLKSFGKE